MVARGVERFVGRIQQVHACAALFQRFGQGQPAQGAEVVVQMRVVAERAFAQFTHGGDRVHAGGRRAVLQHPVVQHLVDTGTDGGERPQGVVQIEGDGEYGEIHPVILRQAHEPGL